VLLKTQGFNLSH